MTVHLSLDKIKIVCYNITMKTKMSVSRFYSKLNADGGLMKKKFEALGPEALFNFLTGSKTQKSYNKITGSLLALRTQWLTQGYEDKTALQGRHEEKVSYGIRSL